MRMLEYIVVFVDSIELVRIFLWIIDDIYDVRDLERIVWRFVFLIF